LPLEPLNPQTIADMIDLKEYQPEPQQEWLDHFATILNKEKNLISACSSLDSTSISSSWCATS
jgi:hypothetical protein